MVRERLCFQNSPLFTFNHEKMGLNFEKYRKINVMDRLTPFVPTLFLWSLPRSTTEEFETHMCVTWEIIFLCDAYMPHQAKMSLIRWENLFKKVRWQNLFKIFISPKSLAEFREPAQWFLHVYFQFPSMYMPLFLIHYSYTDGLCHSWVSQFYSRARVCLWSHHLTYAHY